jgi:hypothetical protein
LWKTYSEENDTDVEAVSRFPNPTITVAAFVAHLDKLGIHEHTIKETNAAVRHLIQNLRADASAFFTSGEILKTVTENVAKGIRRASKYRKMGRLSVLLEHLRNGPSSEDLGWRDFMARTTALLMVFVPSRQTNLLRLDPDEEM